MALAHEAYEANNGEVALAFAEKELAVNPDFFDARFMKAKALYFTNREDTALPILEDLLLGQPKNIDLYFYKAGSLFFMEKYDESTAAAAKCLEISPKYGGCYMWLARINEKLGNYDSALRYARLANKYKYQKEYAYLTEGAIRSDIYNDPDGAIKVYTKCIKELKENIGCLGARSDIYYYNRKDIPSAQKDIETVLTKTPNDYYALLFLARLKYDQKLKKESLAYAAEGYQYGKGEHLFLYAYAEFLEDKNQYYLADKIINEALALNKDNADYFLLRSRTRTYLYDFKGAREDLSSAEKLTPQDGRSLSFIGATYLNLQEFDRAIAVLKLAAAKGNDAAMLALQELADNPPVKTDDISFYKDSTRDICDYSTPSSDIKIVLDNLQTNFSAAQLEKMFVYRDCKFHYDTNLKKEKE